MAGVIKAQAICKNPEFLIISRKNFLYDDLLPEAAFFAIEWFFP